MQAWRSRLILLFLFNFFMVPANTSNARNCSEFFTYFKDGSGGVLSISPPYNSTTITVDLEFTVNVKFETENYGNLEMVEEEYELLERLKRNDSRKIDYTVRFPIRSPLPYVTKLVVNDETICQFQSEPRPPSLTWYSINHSWSTTIPLIMGSPKNSQSKKPLHLNRTDDQNTSLKEKIPLTMQYIPTTIKTTLKTTQVPLTCPPPSKCECPATPSVAPSERNDHHTDNYKFQLCGESPLQYSLLAIKGKRINRGQYPWLTAIYHTSNKGIEFKCGGSLVSAMHVVTAGHCVSNGETILRERDIVLYLNKFEMFDFSESTSPRIARISTHPGYKMGYQYPGTDLAVIVFKEKVIFGPYIKPVCLWNPERDYPDKGKVAGWGRTEFEHTSTGPPKEVEMSVLDYKSCKANLRSHTDDNFPSNNTFCGIELGASSGPCHGDSGGGLYILAKQQKRWYLKGIVSQALLDSEGRNCDTSMPTLFTDISRVHMWIRQVIQQDNISLPLDND